MSNVDASQGDRSTRLGDLMGGPLVSAMFSLAQEEGTLPLADQTPEMVLHLLAAAETDLNPHEQDLPQRLQIALSRSKSLEPLIQGELSSGIEYWWEPMGRMDQIWTAHNSFQTAPSQDALEEAKDRFGGLGDHRIHPIPVMTTSTNYDGRTSFEINASYDDGLDALFDLPAARYQVPVQQTARIYEVRRLQDWAVLLESYRPHGETGVDWDAAAKDWDGIHVGIAGLLTTERRRLLPNGSKEEVQILWGSEHTAWLNWVFEEPTPLSPFVAYVEPLFARPLPITKMSTETLTDRH